MPNYKNNWKIPPKNERKLTVPTWHFQSSIGDKNLMRSWLVRNVGDTLSTVGQHALIGHLFSWWTVDWQAEFGLACLMGEHWKKK